MKVEVWFNIAKKSIVPMVLIISVILFYILYMLRLKVWLAPTWSSHIERTFFALGVITVTHWLQRISGVFFGWYKENIVDVTITKLDDEFLPLFAKAVGVVLWAIALIIVLSNYGININALITALGVSSLAIALAAQDTISNLIAGFLIMIDRPFAIGDTIKLPTGEKVKVLDIGVRRSKFLGENNAIFIVPNVQLSNNKIENYNYREGD